MRHKLPLLILEIESAINSFDNFKGLGIHLVDDLKRGNIVHYFDLFRNLRTPFELKMYFNSKCHVTIKYNYGGRKKIE